MRLQIVRRATVNAPSAKTWRVIAHEFDQIERWSSGIQVSTGSEGEGLDGAPVAGRYCDTSQERFTHYNEQAMDFGYQMVDPPWFLRGIGNHWRVQALAPDKSLIEMKPVIDCHPLFGVLLAPVLKLVGRIVADRTFAELVHYIEHDTPHPRKRKAQQKLSKVH